MNHRKLSSSEFTKAIARYARRHNMSRSLVRNCTSVQIEALREWKEGK